MCHGGLDLWRGSGCHCVSQERVAGARSSVDIDALSVLRIVNGESVVYLVRRLPAVCRREAIAELRRCRGSSSGGHGGMVVVVRGRLLCGISTPSRVKSQRTGGHGYYGLRKVKTTLFCAEAAIMAEAGPLEPSAPLKRSRVEISTSGTRRIYTPQHPRTHTTI
jgi:hypothetical protein